MNLTGLPFLNLVKEHILRMKLEDVRAAALREKFTKYMSFVELKR